MRRTLLPSAALLAAACGARTGLDAGDGAAAVCGNGIVEPGEACDPGGAAGGVCAIYVVSQSARERRVMPVTRSLSAVGFYAYASKSAHTGFEGVFASRLFLYLDRGSGELSLFTEHGIDIDSTGIAQPVSDVVQRFTNLPEGTFIAIADDDDKEASMKGATSALGTWNFEANTDGAVFSGLPRSGAFAVDVESDFQVGIDEWAWVDADGTLIPLDLGAVTTVERRLEPCGCRPDCTEAGRTDEP